jgi:dTDP-glucose 4,6-dehydratase
MEVIFMRVMLVTGGSGFIGSNFIRFFLRRNKNFIIVNLDNLSYSSNHDNLKDLERSPRYHFVKGSIVNQDLVNYVIKRHRPDYIIHFASESGVEKNSRNSLSITQTNVLGTQSLLESALYFWGKHHFEGNRFIHVSTDEVYGNTSDKEIFFSEESPILPLNPYSASKAGADLLVKSFAEAYDFPAIITRCCPNYGPHQKIVNFIPRCIKNALSDTPIDLHDRSSDIKEWIYVLDHCVALIRVLFYGRTGEIYNIGSGEEISNRNLAKMILRLIRKSEDRIEFSDSKLLTHNRCVVNSYKIRNNLGWSSKFKLEDGLRETIDWLKKTLTVEDDCILLK